MECVPKLIVWSVEVYYWVMLGMLGFTMLRNLEGWVLQSKVERSVEFCHLVFCGMLMVTMWRNVECGVSMNLLQEQFSSFGNHIVVKRQLPPTTATTASNFSEPQYIL